jgi:hypothetical protein
MMEIARMRLLLLLISCTAVMQAQGPVAVYATTNVGAEQIQLDGRLNDPLWATASVLNLMQQAPKPGQPTPFATTVRVVVNRDNVYFAFECKDPDPRQLAIHSLQRDGDIDGDDFVSIAIDPYGDRRTGYFFRVNAAGARVDALLAGPEEPSLDWDGIWDARTERTADGWTVEIAIPSRTLNFTKGIDAWGANFERNVARVRTVLRWTSPTLDSFFYDLSRAGTLTGFAALRQGLGLEFSPYLTGRMRAHFEDGQRTAQATVGGDFTYRLTSQLAAVFTANTDFAETEVDTRQLNLTRFELFFPERRTFFLEGSNQYEFGLGLDDKFLPFFSRRIGLFAGEQIALNAGVKVNGRIGKWNIGLLDVQTRNKQLRGGSTVPGTNLLAGRISYDVTPKLRLGSILTNGDPDGQHRNTLVGFDGVYRTSEFMGDKNLLLGVWTARSVGASHSEGDRGGYGFKLDYPNDRWDCFVSFHKFGEALDPALGFIPRPGTHRTDAACEFRPRPRRDGPFSGIRQSFVDNRYYRVTNYRGFVESQRFAWTPSIQTEAGDEISFAWIPWQENLPAAFEIADGVTLPAGRYAFHRLSAELETSENRRVQFGNATQFGTFYSGRLLQQSNFVRYTSLRGAWQVGVASELNFGRLPQGNFAQRLWQLDTTYALSTYVSLTSFLQYDSVSRNVGNNLRLRWTLKPGNDFFFVWNRAWKRLYLTPTDRSLVPDSELLAVKLRWTFRK